ncbi:hypothetical protein DPSP01_003860 [Paraphaeosphaeria sporulosa]
MDFEGPRPSLSEEENSDAKSEAAQESHAASPVSYEPKIRCRLTRDQITSESSNSVRFEFLAEGAANTVFRVVPYSLQDGKESFVFEDDQGNILAKEKLAKNVLRMSKGKPKTLKYKEIMEGFETVVKPLFRKTEPSEEGASSRSTAIKLSINESFEEFIMDHEGVAITPEAINALLAEMHTHCPDNRHIESHHLEERGILLPDMSSVLGSVTTIEIKPKWLLQSPNAPRDAYLCRTCALQASRQSKKTIKKTWICPLALVAGNKAAIEPYIRHRSLSTMAEKPGHHVLRMYTYFYPEYSCPAHQWMDVFAWSTSNRQTMMLLQHMARNYRIRNIAPERVHGLFYPSIDKSSPNSLEIITNASTDRPSRDEEALNQHLEDEVEAVVQRAVPYLTTGPGHHILQHIRYLQGQLDPAGVLSCPLSSTEEDRLRLAMTLRDCSLFIRIPWADPNAPIEAKLGDLDFKSRGKKQDWSMKEEGLLHGGWYVDLESRMDECWIAQGWKKYAPHYF